MSVAKQLLKTEQAPLVSMAKCSTISNANKGHKPSSTLDLMEWRAEQYRLQEQAKDLLAYEARKYTNDPIQVLKFHRTIKCKRVPSLNLVSIHKSIEHQKTFFGGLQTCGSVWSCPICAPKIQKRRVEEIAKAFKWAYANGMKVVMVTFTWPHGISDDLGEMMKKHSQAMRSFRSGDVYTLWKNRIGYQGFIKSLEITYGRKNGWHPHTHELYFVDENADASEMKKFILNRWKKCCIESGLLKEEKIRAFEKNAIDVIDNAKESDYLAKQATIDREKYHWGADKEVAMASTKKGRQSGKTAFQLLADSETDRKSGMLFIEFSMVMRGKHQMDWSRGFKAKVGIEEKTDEQLAEEQRDQADLLALLHRNHWMMVIHEKARAEILNIAQTDGFWGIQHWFAIRGVSLEPPD